MYNDFTFYFENKNEADTFLPLDAYLNTLDIGVDDTSGKYCRLIRLNLEDSFDESLFKYLGQELTKPSVVYMGDEV